MDQFYGRLTRHLQEILQSGQITSSPIVPYPDAGGIAPTEAYLRARSEAIIKLRPIVRDYKEKLVTHLAKESAQITKYFGEMALELNERQKKVIDISTNDEMIQQQKRSLEIEKQARLLDLQKKMNLKADHKLLNLLSVVIPKIVTPLKLTFKQNFSVDLTVVWNPLSQSVEPVSCPSCSNPTLELFQINHHTVRCP